MQIRRVSRNFPDGHGRGDKGKSVCKVGGMGRMGLRKWQQFTQAQPQQSRVTAAGEAGLGREQFLKQLH